MRTSEGDRYITCSKTKSPRAGYLACGLRNWNFKKSLGSRAPLTRCKQATATAGCHGTTTDLARVAHVFRGYAAL